VIPLIPPDFGDRAVSDPPSQGTVRIGMMGRLEDQKNLLYAAQIIAALQTLRPEQKWEFHIYGDGKMREKMASYCASLNINTVFHGRYERSQLFDLIEQNHFYIITSRTEGQCIAALEILAAGRPLFATTAGALPDILSRPERGSLLPPEDPAAAAQIIFTFLARVDALDARKIAAGFIDTYSAKAIKARYCSEISNIVAP